LIGVVNWNDGIILNRISYYENGAQQIIEEFNNNNDIVITQTRYYQSGTITHVFRFMGEPNTHHIINEKIGSVHSSILESGFKEQISLVFYDENEVLRAKGEMLVQKKQDGGGNYLSNPESYSETQMKIGVWEEYHSNKKIQSIKPYFYGDLHGEVKLYHDNGEINQIGNYDSGTPIGEWKLYHRNKSLHKIRVWEDGKLMNIISCLDNQGSTLDKGTLINGNGTEKNYDDNGNLTGEVTYINGKAQK